jgi:hypothetical protein
MRLNSERSAKMTPTHSANSLSSDQVIARIEQWQLDLSVRSSAQDRDHIQLLDACLILLRQQQEPQQNKEKIMALALLPADPLASPASTEPLPNDAETLMSAVQALAAKGYRYWDTDEDSKAGKVLSALAGVRGCYPEIDALYVKVGSGNQSAQEQAPATSRSAAHKDSNNSSPLSPSAAVSPEPRPIKFGTLGVPLALRREPTEKDFADPRFDVIWELIKRVDVDFRDGLFSGATGNDVCAVLDALDAQVTERARIRNDREGCA